MNTINYHMLEAMNACSSQLKLFRETFGVGEVVLNSKNLKTALNTKLDVFFLEKFLSEPQRTEYEKVLGPALEEYRKVAGPAYAEYEKVWGQALEEYEKVKGQALEEFRKVRVQAYTEYEKVRGQAWEEYQKVAGLLLIRILTT